MENMTQGADMPPDIDVDSILLIVFSLLMSLFIISANTLTIVVIHRTPNLRTLSNLYILSLATSDLVVGLGLIPLSLFYVPSLRTHLYDNNIRFCALVFGVNLGVAVVSCVNMTLIATDRYLYIVHPYTYARVVTRHYVILLLCCAWSFGVLYALLPQVIHNDPAKCDVTLVMPIGYLFYANVSLFLVLVAINFVLYTQILLAAYRHSRLISTTTTHPRNQTNTHHHHHTTPHPRNQTNTHHHHHTTSHPHQQTTIKHDHQRTSNPNHQVISTISQVCDVAFNKTNQMELNSLPKPFHQVHPTQTETTSMIFTPNTAPSVLSATPNINPRILTATPNTNPNVPSTTHVKPNQSKPPTTHNTSANLRDMTRQDDKPAHKKHNLRMKSVKFFMTVFGVYFVCFAPTVVCMGVDYFLPVPRFLYNMFNLLALMNSGMNFIIYLTLNSKFKLAVKKYLGLHPSPNSCDVTDMSSPWDK